MDLIIEDIVKTKSPEVEHTNFFIKMFTRNKDISESEQQILNVTNTLLFDQNTEINYEKLTSGDLTILDNRKKDVLILFDENTKTVKLANNTSVHIIKLDNDAAQEMKLLIRNEKTKRFKLSMKTLDEKIFLNLQSINHDLDQL